MENDKRFYHECESGIEESAPRISVWHHKAWRVITNGDLEERIFVLALYTNDGFFFLLTVQFCFFFLKIS